MYRLLRHWLIMLFLPACLFSQQVKGTWTFNVGGVSRTSIVYVPSGISNPPLLISMHGMGIPASWNQQMMKFEPIADRDKFIVTYPEAAPGSDLRWDLGSNKDVAFIEAIIDSMHSRFNIDLNRVYASGFSMGGMMSYYLACKIPEKIAAIAPGCGYPLGGQSGCKQTRPVPIFHIHGTADDFVKYSNLHAFLNTKIAEYGCPQTAQRTEPYPSSNPASQSFKEYWGPCFKNGQQSDITLISVKGMIHDWATPGKMNANEDPLYNGKPFDVNGSEEAWAYLKTQSLQSKPKDGEQIVNGDFSSGSSAWTLNIWGGAASGSVENGEYKLNVSTDAENAHDIQLVQSGLYLENGKNYQVTFDAYAALDRTLEVNVEMANSPWTSYLPQLQNFNLTPTKQTYSFVFRMEQATDANGRLGFNVGQAIGTVFIDNVSVEITTAVSALASQSFRTTPVCEIRVNRGRTFLKTEFTASRSGLSSVKIYNLNGSIIKEMHLETRSGGLYSGIMDLTGIPNGFYAVKIDNNGRTIISTKMCLIN